MLWSCRVSLAFLAGCVVAFGPSRLDAQAFDCVVLNDDNTNIFVTPEDCFVLPEDASWCNCVRSLFSNPVRGEVSGFSQSIVSIVDQPGIGNHRVEVFEGTLDLSGLEVGDVIGGSIINELIPQSVGVPPGTFFVVETQVVVTALEEQEVEFDVLVTDVSPAALLILDYDPTAPEHSDGLFYRGRLTSRGAGEGFTMEYRYPSENVREGLEPAISVGDQADPGFTVRSTLTFFSTESGLYTLPGAGSVDVETTLRRFSEDSVDQILPLGAEDLCVVLEGQVDEMPCKSFEEELGLRATLEDNGSPTAAITIVDPVTSQAFEDPAEISTFCGEARIILVGRNSDDGDGGLQGLEYEWSVLSGPEGGAVIPEATRTFRDTEVTFVELGEYEIQLRVDDGQDADNVDEASVTIVVDDALEFNVVPTPLIVPSPDPAEVEIVGEPAIVTLDGSGSSAGFLGEDDCGQVLTFLWTVTGGPEGGATLLTPTEAVTDVEFRLPGDYTVELEVDDGEEENNLGSDEILIIVTGEPVSAELFRRADADADGAVNITDAIRSLNWLFLGAAEPPCQDAADADDSGQVNITDAIVTLGFLFLGGVPPAAPGPTECGGDPSEDALPDCVYDCQD